LNSRFTLQDETATTALAQRAAQAMPATSPPLVLYLEGDLGVGKTSFARGMILALGEAGPVRSPSYGLVAPYSLTGGDIIHVDLYRLRDEQELDQLGIRDYLPGSRLWLIEWPDKVSRGLPAADARLRFEVAGKGRALKIEAITENGRLWLSALSACHFS
jgi:tRNA threonylcarbamoyladenosine biosynthesis protein TsaE